MNSQEFLDELRQMVIRRAASLNMVDTLAFVTEVSERLADDPSLGEITSVDYSTADSKRRTAKIHGYSEPDEIDNAVSLVIGRWDDDESVSVISSADVDRLQKQVENFARASVFDKLYQYIPEATTAYEIAYALQDRKNLTKLRIHVFLNQELSSRYRGESIIDINGITAEVHIWDLKRLKAIYESSREREALTIDVKEFGSGELSCLKAVEVGGLESYLCVIEGEMLADLFDRYGSRLLEGNVRAFLGMKGGVNKGIRATIQDTPHLFFAYNNGIAATAESIEVEETPAGLRIRSVADLQIVNGGQTTASVLRARKQDRLKLAGVSVPMKLTVVDHKIANDLVPRIAEYANTQNKVAVADFFSNHPFHRKMEEISRRLLTPARGGSRVQSKWFYERARGQYQNERLYLTAAQKNAHDLEYPSNQVINKTDLAKFDSAINEKPFRISQGTQRNFMDFASQFNPKDGVSESEYWEKISPKYGDGYYQQIVGMAILWKTAESIVAAGKNDWYFGDYRQQIVAYGSAILLKRLREREQELAFSKIWEQQSVSDEVKDAFRDAAIFVQDHLLKVPGGSSDPAQWAKRTQCWTSLVESNFELRELSDEVVIDTEEGARRRRERVQQARQDDEINLQFWVLEQQQKGYWTSLAAWANIHDFVTPSQYDLISKAAHPKSVLKLTTERQFRALRDLSRRCEGEGFRHG